MSTAAKVAGFILGLAAVFLLMLGVGRITGPVGDPTVAHDGEQHNGSETRESGHGDQHGDQSGETEPTTDLPGGLQASDAGYTLVPRRTTLRPGPSVPVSFMITGPGGEPVTGYNTVHDKRLHLIAVRRDHTGFQHVHPHLRSDGTWHTRLDLAPGTWRMFAEFTATGADPVTLGADLQVPGDYQPAAPAAPRHTASVDGYRVTLGGYLSAGESAQLTLRVSRDGRPVTDLQPYLGAYGHLVALREGDLAYLHVHPDGALDTSRPGPAIVFRTEVPSEGRYRLYLDFKHDNRVHTASFVVATPSGGDATTSHTPEGGHDDEADSHDH